MTQNLESRRFRRITVDIRVFARTADERFADDAVDLSEAGVKVATTRPLPAGGQYVFALELPHHEVPLEICGRVVWSRPAQMGIRFDHIDDRLAAFVERQRWHEESL